MNNSSPEDGKHPMSPSSEHEVLLSLTRDVSPPPRLRQRKLQDDTRPQTPAALESAAPITKKPSTAAIEAGEIIVDDPVIFFTSKLTSIAKHCSLQTTLLSSTSSNSNIPPTSATSLTHQFPQTIPPSEWISLYHANALSNTGHHFVIHQHDHPVAGTHYDLRLQCNGTSSISFAIMYGLPGDPNSRRLNRNATETRVHCLWNHLIETASLQTGSLLIWDTGMYEVLPYADEKKGKTRAIGSSGSEDDADRVERGGINHAGLPSLSEQQKLHEAFQQRKVKLRLHGSRLPPGYTISLRLTQDNFRAEQPDRPKRRRKRRKPAHEKPRHPSASQTSGSDTDADTRRPRRTVLSLSRGASPPILPSQETDTRPDSNSDSETIRRNNAYTGATNSINSIHQRRWYLSLDRRASGFIPSKTTIYGNTIWMRGQGQDGEKVGFERFHVLGREVERSVVTSRLASEILRDEGVVGHVPRGLWRAVTE